MKDRDSSVQVEIVDGLFDKIPVADASADLVVVAQGAFSFPFDVRLRTSPSEVDHFPIFRLRSYPTTFSTSRLPTPTSNRSLAAFHWVGEDGTSAITEIARVLKPGGAAIFIWNLEDREQHWVAKLRDLYEVHEAGELSCRSPALPFASASSLTFSTLQVLLNIVSSCGRVFTTHRCTRPTSSRMRSPSSVAPFLPARISSSTGCSQRATSPPWTKRRKESFRRRCARLSRRRRTRCGSMRPREHLVSSCSQHSGWPPAPRGIH